MRVGALKRFDGFFGLKLRKQNAKCFCVALFILLIYAGLIFPQSSGIPVNIQFQIFFKILSYDKKLDSRGSDGLKFLIVYQKKFRSSLAVHDDIRKMLDDYKFNDVEKIPLTFHFADIDEISLAESIAKDKINLVYFCPLRGIDIKEISLITRERDVLSFTDVPGYVGEGISVGLELINQKPRILINLSASKEEHADFSSQLLKISKIVEEER